MAKRINAIIDKWDRIDVLVNSCGHWPRAPILELTEHDRHTGLHNYLLNETGPNGLVTSIMQQHKNGVMISISTFAAFEPDPVFSTSGVFPPNSWITP